MTVLRIDNKKLTQFPDISAMENLTAIYCSQNAFKELPPLPATLRFLICPYNDLRSLPPLKHCTELTHLVCYTNYITEMPELPPSLRVLVCDQNQIAALPPLPPLLEILACCQNLLTALPPLPQTLESFHCARNQLTCVPVIRSRLMDVFCEGNRFGELFDRIAVTYTNPADAIVAYHAIQKGRDLVSMELSISKLLPCDVLSVIGSFLSGNRGTGQLATLRSCIEGIRWEQEQRQREEEQMHPL